MTIAADKTPRAKAPARRTPAWLLTGWLGSGKTTLLKAWLHDAPPLADAALIINELGEVGLDDKLVAGAADAGAALIANTCVCCTGLPGLEEALVDLFWDRLHRTRPPFSSVVIETTGLADPAPVVELFDRAELLRERYELAGVVTCVSACAGVAVLHKHPEARAQAVGADVLIITKTDLADHKELVRALRDLNPSAAIGTSARASLAWDEVLQLRETAQMTQSLTQPGAGQVVSHSDDHSHHLAHDHHHDHARSEFLALDAPLSLAGLYECIDQVQRSGQLLRLKGIVRTEDGVLREVQWSAGDRRAEVQPAPKSLQSPPLGLTCIFEA